MATITGQSLVDAIQASTGVTLNPLLQATLAARLQQQLDTGTYSPLAAAVAIQGFSTEIKAVVDANGGSTAFSTHLTEVAAAIQNDTPVPEFVPEADQTFALTAGADAVDEGATATFTLTTTGVAEGTAVAYTLSGIDAADLASGALTGNAVVGADGTATISVVLAADGATEGAETLTVTLDGKTVSATTTVNDTSVLGQTFALTKGVDKGAAFTGGEGNDTFIADFDFETAAGTGSHTLGALDEIDGAGGVNTLAITNDDGAAGAYTMAAAKITNIQNITIKGAGAVTADVSGSNVTGLEKISVLQSVAATITASDTQNVEVSGATGGIEVRGGKDVTVTNADDANNIVVGYDTVASAVAAPVGAVTVTSTKQGAGTIDIDGGTDVTVNGTAALKNAAAPVTVGQITIGANEQASGDVVVTQTLTSDATDGLTGSNVSVTGGSTVDVTVNATVTAKDKNAEGDIAIGTVTVEGDGNTTSVKVTQNATATEFETAAVDLVGATQTVTFKDLAKNATVTVNGLTFTAAKDLTAAQVAQAFANLAASDKQEDGGPVANGFYTNAFTTTTVAGWTSGAANGATVTFTAPAHNSAPLVISSSVAASTPTAAPIVAGTAVAGVASTTNDITKGKVTVVDNDTTDAITTVTLDGFNGADIGVDGVSSAVSQLDALTTLNLANNTTDDVIEVGTAATTLELNVNNIRSTGTTYINLDNDGNGVGDQTDATVETLTINATGAASRFELVAGALKNLTVNASVGLDVSDAAASYATANLKTVDINGAGAVNLGDLSASVALNSFDASGNTGGVTATVEGDGATLTGDLEEYVFSGGNDTVTVEAATGTAVDVKVSLGAGDDKLTLASGINTAGAVLDGGTGTNTLHMDAADAAIASAVTNTFEGKISNFQKLSLGQVAQATTASVNLANMGDISYVISAGGAAGVGGSDESADVTFVALTSGQSVTVAGVTVTASEGDMTAAQVATAFASKAVGDASGWTVTNGAATGSLVGYTTGAASTDTVTFTSTTPGTAISPDLTATVANSTTPTIAAPTVTDGVDPVNENVTVSFSSLIPGETTVIDDGNSNTITVTAPASREVYTFVDNYSSSGSETFIVNGITVTWGAGGAAAASYATAYAAILNGATKSGSATGTGSATDPNWVWSADGADLIATYNGTAVATLGASSGAATSLTPVTTSPASLTAIQVAQAVADTVNGGVVANVTTSGTFDGWTVVRTTNNLTFTSESTGTAVNNLTVANSGTVVTYNEGGPGTAETASFTFVGLLSGQAVTVGDATVRAPAGNDLTAEEVAQAFQTTAPAGYTGAATGATVLFTRTTNGNVGNLTATITPAPAPAAITPSVSQGGQGGVAAGELTLTEMANNGTLELTGAGAVVNVSVTDAGKAGQTSNILNVIVSDALTNGGINVGSVVVDDVETINVKANDAVQDADKDGKDDTNAAHTIDVDGDSVITINVDGAGDVTLTTTSTVLEAVNATNLTGKLTYNALVAETVVTGGFGVDTLTASANQVVINSGAGNDRITIADNVDKVVVDGGAGSDTFIIAGAASNKDSYAVFQNVGSGDIFDFGTSLAGYVTDFRQTKITLSEGATESSQAYLNQAVKDLAQNEMGWFQYGGNTFIVVDKSNSTTAFQDGTDVVIMITGLVNLDTAATFNSTSALLEII